MVFNMAQTESVKRTKLTQQKQRAELPLVRSLEKQRGEQQHTR